MKKARSPFTIVKQPKQKCYDFDSDCLTIENHLACWVYDKERGYCPFLQSIGMKHFNEGRVRMTYCERRTRHEKHLHKTSTRHQQGD
jgi:UDP-N-acetylglucosamine pyrophosphorylase